MGAGFFWTEREEKMQVPLYCTTIGALRLFSGVSQWLVPWLYPNKGAAVDGAKPAVEGRWGDWLIPNKLWTLVPRPLC